MTRKKSNVKALALAVTCAILAGGYSGLNPVYAADKLYKDSSDKVTTTTTTNEITELNVGGAIIGATGTVGGTSVSSVTAHLGGFNNVLVNDGLTVGAVGGVVSANNVSIGGGGIVATSGTNKVTIGNGAIIATGDITGQNITAKGNLSVTGTSTFTGETTFANGISAAGGKFTVKADGQTVFTGDPNDKGKTTIKNGETVVEGANGKVTINNGGIEIAQKAQGTEENYSIKLDSGYVDASGYVKAPKFYIDNDNKFEKNSLSVAGVDSNGNQQYVRIGGGTITTSDDVNVSGTLYTNTIGEATTGTGVTVDGVKFNAGAVSGVSGINDDILQFTQNGTENIVQINSDLRLNDNTGGKAAILSVEGLAALNSMVYDATGKINNDAAGKPIIQAGNGSVVGGVKLDNKNIANVDSITVNEGKENQVKITSEGIVVGLTSAAINGDGFYAGGHNYNDAKAALDGKDGKIKGAGGKFGVDEYGNVTTTANIKGKDITAEGNLTVDGDAEVKKDLKVTGNITGADITAAGALKGKTLGIGATGTEFTVDTVGNVTANGITTSDTTTNKIGGVTLAGSDINAKNLTLTGTLTAAKYNATDIEATNSIKVGATTMTNGKLDLGSNGTIDFGANELTDVQVGNINSVIQPGGIVKAADGSVIGGVTFSAKDITGVKDLTATGKVSAATITDGTASLSGGALTGLASVNIGGNTTIDNTGIKTNKLIVGSGLNATTIDEANGVVSAKGKIGDVKFTGAGKLENVTSIDGVSVAQNSGSAAGGLTFGGNAIIGATGIPFQSTGFKVDDDGDVEGKTFTTAADGTGNRSTLASGQLTIDPKNTWTKDNGIIASNVKVGTNELKDDGLHVGTNTLVKDGEITVGAGNSWSMANGIAATKAAINGVTIGETAGKAVFNNAGKATTIDGDTIQTGKITADELLIDKISLGKGGSSNITIDKDGHVQTKGDIKITDAAGNVMSKLSQDQATFGNAADNQTTINNGKLKAKAKNTANQQAEFNFDENGLTVSGQNAAGATSSFGFNAANGIGTFTGQDNSTTAINGSAITSTNGGATGVLNGSNLTLTNGADKTELTAGGASFTGAAGEKGGKTTTIAGGTITTDTLNVERINLGGEVIDKGAAGVEANSKLYMDAQGNFRAAGGNFKVNGADGAMTNTVGNTTLKTDANGAGMSYDNTAATGGVKSNISVADGKAEMAVGTNAAVTATDGKVEIKGGTQNVTTTDAGTVFENSAHNTPFVTGGAANTVINGNEITTGKLTTDQLVITGSGAAGGAGSIAFGGDGSITSNIKDAATGKEATFKTNADGTFTEAKDGANVTTNTVNAQGNTNKVTDGTNTSTATQTATSIGGVVTNGTVTMKQELTADGLKLEQTGYDEVNIAKGDVTVKNNRNTANPNQEVHLSDLGSLNNLDGELAARDEYQDNKTAVGAINAEAGIRREEVARLDNRIDDVNNRVDKVGAMAAAIASLKSIGYDPQAPSEFSIGLGQYKGETGVAMGFFHYPNKNFMINVSLSTAGGETMGGIGATWRFGHKSPQKLLDEQREAQARKELAAAEKYQAAAKLAKEAQERAEYAAKLARQAQVSADNAKAAADATQAKHFQ